MKRVKVLLILLFVMLLTGCSGVYNLKINDDLTVEESTNLKLDYSEDSYNKAIKLFEENKIPEDNYSIVVNDSSMEIEYNNNYDSVEDYIINSKIYSQLFPHIDYINDGNTILLNTNSVFSNNVKLLNINIETPFNVKENNADSLNDNIYTWEINSNTDYKEINMELDFDSTKNNYAYLFVIIFASIILLLPIAYFIYRYIRSRKM